MVAFNTSSVPPALKIPPPPSLAIAPLAVFPSIVVPSTVIVPEPFHSPPPSAAAVFPDTVPLVTEALPGPVICNPPPLPGALPTVLLFKVTLNSVISPTTPVELSSIPPPARLALLFEISVLFTTTVPPSTFWIPPPEPAVPVAKLFVIVVPF